MTPLRLAFLALAAWGAVHPMYWFLKHMRETGTRRTADIRERSAQVPPVLAVRNGFVHRPNRHLGEAGLGRPTRPPHDDGRARAVHDP